MVTLTIPNASESLNTPRGRPTLTCRCVSELLIGRSCIDALPFRTPLGRVPTNRPWHLVSRQTGGRFYLAGGAATPQTSPEERLWDNHVGGSMQMRSSLYRPSHHARATF